MTTWKGSGGGGERKKGGGWRNEGSWRNIDKKFSAGFSKIMNKKNEYFCTRLGSLKSPCHNDQL